MATAAAAAPVEVPLTAEQQAAAEQLLADLKALNAAERDAYADIVADYQAIYADDLEHQVLAAQLEKEAGELREEATARQSELERLQHRAADGANAAEAEAKAAELQAEMNQLYKAKSQLDDQLHRAHDQLAVVRESHEHTSKEVDVQARRIARLNAHVDELQAEVDREREAAALATSELEGRLADKEAAEAEAEKLRGEVSGLAARLVELETTKVERMNEVNRICEQMMSNAKQYEKTAEAHAAAVGSRLALAAGAGARNLFNMIQPKRSGSSGASGAQNGGRRSSDAEPAVQEAVVVSALKATVPTRAAKSVPAHAGGAFGLAWERSGARLASAGADRTVKLWDPSGLHLTTLQGMREGVLDVSWTCDGAAVLGAGNDKSIQVWDPTTGRARHTMTGHTGKVTAVEGSPMEASRAVSSGTDRCLKVWDLGRGYNIATMMNASSCNALALSLDGALIASGHFDGGLRCWDARSGKLIQEIRGLHAGQICSVAAGSLGGSLLTAGKDNTLQLVDLRTYKSRMTLRAHSYAVGGVWTGAALGPDEQHAAAGSHDGTVFVWELVRGGVAAKLKGSGTAPVLGCAWSPQGIPLASCDNAGAITFWTAPDADAQEAGTMSRAAQQQGS